MPRGFIQDELHIKLLILYILNRTDSVTTLPQLSELALCDEGVNYFSLTDALGKLIATEHVLETGGGFAITDKGREHLQLCESNLPYSIRQKCDRNMNVVK